MILFTEDDVRVPADRAHLISEPILRRDTDTVAGCVAVAPHLERPWLQGPLRQ